MVKEIKIRNVITNETIIMNKTGDEFVLDSIDWDKPVIGMETYKVPFQIGENLIGVTAGYRKPLITGYIIADLSNVETLGMTWKEYYKLQEQKIEESKLKLDRIISIYEDIEITVNDYKIICRPCSPPVYSSSEIENNEVQCLFDLELRASNPMFLKDEKEYKLASTFGLFVFPFNSTNTEKIVFGEIQKRKSILIENNGDVKSGCIITIKASGGTITNPKVYNVNTGEYISFDGVVLNDGDILTINTNKSEENAIHHILESGNERSLIGNIGKGSVFLQIEKGSSFYAYEIPEEEQNNADVSIMFNEQYFNFKGM